MTAVEALTLLDNLVSRISLPRAEHMQAVEASQTLAKIVNELESPTGKGKDSS